MRVDGALVFLDPIRVYCLNFFQLLYLFFLNAVTTCYILTAYIKSKRHYFGWLIVYTSQKSELSEMALIVLTA